MPVGLVNADDTKTGTAVCNWSVNIGSSDSLSFTTRNSSADNTVITVSKPLDNFITGGGFLVMPSSSSAGQAAG